MTSQVQFPQAPHNQALPLPSLPSSSTIPLKRVGLPVTNQTWQNQAHRCHHIRTEVGNSIGGPELLKHRKKSGTTPIPAVRNPRRAPSYSAMTNRQRSDNFMLPISQSVDSVGSVLVVSLSPLVPPILLSPPFWSSWNWLNVWLLNSAPTPISFWIEFLWSLWCLLCNASVPECSSGKQTKKHILKVLWLGWCPKPFTWVLPSFRICVPHY